MERVDFMENEEGDDLLISFALPWDDDHLVRSLILQRSPGFEFLFDDDERGVYLSDEAHEEEEDWARSIEFSREVVRIKSDFRDYELDVRGVAQEEWEQAKRILKAMNYDDAFELKFS